MNEALKEIGIAVVAIIGALSGAGIIIRIKRSKTNSNNTKVVQKRNTVGGDLAGRDIHK